MGTYKQSPKNALTFLRGTRSPSAGLRAPAGDQECLRRHPDPDHYGFADDDRNRLGVGKMARTRAGVVRAAIGKDPVRGIVSGPVATAGPARSGESLVLFRGRES